MNQSLSEIIKIYHNKSGLIRESQRQRVKYLNRLGFIILSILESSNATGRLSSMTIREIASAEELEVKENTIFKKIHHFERLGYIGRGLKEGRANTYFITPKGCTCLENERGSL